MIISILTFISSDLILSYYLVNNTLCIPGENCPSLMNEIINPGVLLISLFAAALIYIVWSFIEKDNKRK